MATEPTHTSEQVGNLLDAQRLCMMQAMLTVGLTSDQVREVLIEANNIVKTELTRRMNGLWEE